MANSGQGPFAPGADLDALLRRYRQAWHDALQGAADAGAGAPGGGEAAADPWRAARDAWMGGARAARADAGDTLSRLNPQAAGWLAMVQQLAARFAGQDTTPEAVVEAWRGLLGGDGAGPMEQMFADAGAGVPGWQSWVEWLAPPSGRTGGHRDWSQLPTFGPGREHQARWQELARVFAGYQRSQQAFQDLLAQASQGAFTGFERRLRERDEPVDSPRALFDLWIDAAEEAYAEVALSPPFRSAYAEMVAGQMRLRQAIQREIEHACRLFDLPTRSELDGAHRKLAGLEREMRRLRDRLDAVESANGPAPVRPPPHAAASPDASPQAPADSRGRGPAASTGSGTKRAAASGAAKQAASGSAAGRGAARAKPAAARTRSASARDDRATGTSTAGAAGTGARTKPVPGPAPAGTKTRPARATAATGQAPASPGSAAPGTATPARTDTVSGSGAAARDSKSTGNADATRARRRTR